MCRKFSPLLIAAVLGFALGHASAQGVVIAKPVLATVQDFGFDQVDSASLSTSFRIPLAAREGRGISLAATLNYNSQIWSTTDPWGFARGSWYPSPGSFGWTSPVMGTVSEGGGSEGTCGYPVYDDNGDYIGDDGSVDLYFYQYLFVDAAGVPHPFSGAWYSGSDDPATDCPRQSSGYSESAGDSSGYTLTVDDSGMPTVTSIDNTSFSVWGPISDRNGNQISYSYQYCYSPGNPAAECTENSQTIWKYFDTLDGSTPFLTISSSTASPAPPTTYTYLGVGGRPLTITEQFASHLEASSFGCSDEYEWSSGSQAMPSELDLPDGTKYTFLYGANGQLTSVSLPTGGTINYDRSYSCSFGAAFLQEGLSRTDSVTGGAGWSWASNASSASATDPDGHTTQFHFNGGGLVSSISNSASTDYLCYNGATLGGSTCTSTPSGPVTEVSRYTVLSDTNQARLSDVQLIGPRPTEVDEYDWGPGGTHGSMLQKTLTTYALYGFPAAITTEDGAGNITTQTTFGYDESAVTASGASQLAAPTGARENLTSITQWVNPSSSLVKHFSYFDTGQVQSATDANGAATNFIYGACNQAFPTLVQELVSSLTVSMGWDCTGGVMTSYTDENGNTAATSYGDPAGLWRPTASTDAAGNQTNYSYTNASGSVPAQTEAAMAFNGGASTSDVLTTLDGLGRATISQTRQGPGATTFESVQTKYDLEGRASQVSAPYIAAANAVAPAGTPFNSTSFDFSGRTATITDTGGGTSGYQYFGNDVLITQGPAPAGENAKQKQLESDGLGRLASVCEIVTDTTSGATPGSGTCAQQHPLNGYWTQYAYSRVSAGNLVAITQNAEAPAGNQETRDLTFDGAGRLVAETNPETGTINFAFDSEASYCGITSRGDMIMRRDAIGNVSCYAHDAAHRLTAVTYPSGPYSAVTPEKHFVYDGAAVGGLSMTGVKGALAEAYTGPQSAKITDLGFSLDALGSPTEVLETTPHSGNWYHMSATYWPNGLLHTLSGIGLPVTLTYAADPMGRTSAVSDASGKGPVTGVSYGLYGPTSVALGSGDSDQFSFDASTGRMTQFQFSVGGAADTGTLGWNANGSLGTLRISDGIAGTADTESCSYGHDDLGRARTANCGAVWNQTFWDDAFGNMSKTAATGTAFSASFNLKNQVASVGGMSPRYDGNGNLLDDPVRGTTGAYAWAADGSPVTLAGAIVITDALGRVVETQSGGTNQELFYGPGGRMATLQGMSLVAASVPLPSGGHAIYSGAGLVGYQHADWLGSSRLTTGPSSALIASQAYGPYGEPYATASSTDASFTGQQQGTVTGPAGLYDFLLREQSPTQSRWLSPDPGGAATAVNAEPQSLNRYSYVGNVPLNSTDFNGLVGPCPNGTAPATPAQAKAYIAVAESYRGHGLTHANDQHFDRKAGGALAAVDCSGLVMLALANQSYSHGTFANPAIGNIATGEIRGDSRFTGGIGAVGDIALFPGHMAIVTSPYDPKTGGKMFGSQGGVKRPGGPETATIGPGHYWNSPQFLRPCLKPSQFATQTSGGGGGGAGGGGGGIAGINWDAWNANFTSWLDSITTDIEEGITYESVTHTITYGPPVAQ